MIVWVVPNGSPVDNIEDLDTMVGWLAESTRPHGFAISETQLQGIHSERVAPFFSDRFLTSSFAPRSTAIIGVQWVND